MICGAAPKAAMEPDRAPEKKEGRAPVVFGGARLARARSAAGAALTAAAASDPPLQVGAVAYPLGFGTGFCQNYEFTSWSALRGAGATPQLPNPLYKQQNQQQQGSGQIADDDWTMLVYRPGAPPAEPTLTPQQQQQQQERRAKLIPDFYPVPAGTKRIRRRRQRKNHSVLNFCMFVPTRPVVRSRGGATQSSICGIGLRLGESNRR